tara:strand:- start:4694 stop:5122 length:429 start_codon:yes stop_codon:yes gene_type:complete
MEKVHKGLCGVYQFINTKNSNRYIGSSLSLANKFENSITALMSGVFDCEELQKEWSLYGPESFEFSIIELVDDKYQINDRAKYWLDTLPSISIDNDTDRDFISGHVSISRDLKSDIRASFQGTYDDAVKELISFYENHLKSE